MCTSHIVAEAGKVMHHLLLPWAACVTSLSSLSVCVACLATSPSIELDAPETRNERLGRTHAAAPADARGEALHGHGVVGSRHQQALDMASRA